MDIRAFGKGFEDLFQRSKEAGTQYIRGIPGEIEEDPETKSLRLFVENTTEGGTECHEVDMVVLSVGAVPRRDSDGIGQLLTLQRSQDGFFLEAHPKLKPVDAATQGVFFAGCAESPKDIKDSVTQAERRRGARKQADDAGEGQGRGHHVDGHPRAVQVVRHLRRRSARTTRSRATRRPRRRRSSLRPRARVAARAAPSARSARSR